MMRIFWLGMHKILKPTELTALRDMGYEVFNPPYISAVYDQSADLSLDSKQPTTLPAEIFDELHTYNFFYEEITPRIAEILNSYFDAVIVTINGDWLYEILKAFRGNVIFRVFGQPYVLSDHLISIGVWHLLQSRDNFQIVPFAIESIEKEHPWFKDLCQFVVPYQISNDVFDHQKRWSLEETQQEVSVSIPNIENPYYSSIYHFFTQNFVAPYFRILGPQRTLPADPRILGAMRRDRFLDHLAMSRAYLYPYTDDVCYLPPIEMMQLGGPVIYLPGSLLARFSDPRNPAGAASASHANTILGKLLQGDRGLASEILSAQETVRLRYDRAIVRPTFEKIFKSIIENPVNISKIQIDPIRKGQIKRTVIILLHIDGFFHFVAGRSVALEGIPRVVDAIVSALTTIGDFKLVLTSTRASAPVLADFFSDALKRGFAELLIIDNVSNRPIAVQKLQYVKNINAGELQADIIFVPHYYLFPEALMINKPKVLYLPDYFPHLLPKLVFDSSKEKDEENKGIGTLLGNQAKFILTNSQFTKSYISEAGFCRAEDEDQKVIVAPLPLLGKPSAGNLDPKDEERLRLRTRGEDFLFYPTANRPNKRLVLCLRVLAFLRLSGRKLNIVLTCSLDSVPEVRRAAEDYHLLDHIILATGSSEFDLRWYYENCAALCLTSVAEGNFPPQVLEALHYRAPIVATRLPTITELLGASGGGLLLCEAEELVSFVDNIEIAINQREDVLNRQQETLERLLHMNSQEIFAGKMLEAFS